MNILFLLSNYPGFGGIEKVTTDLTSYLIGKGYGLSILAFGTNAPQQIDELQKDITLDFVPDQHQYRSANNTALSGSISANMILTLWFCRTVMHLLKTY